MAKKRNKDRLENHIQPAPQLINEMRGLVQATRARSALRSLTPTQAKARINELYKETVHEYENLKRQVPKDSVQRNEVFGRRATNQPAMPRERMPASVRNLFQDAKRALVCSTRETRREVMFSMRRTGKAGARRNKKARWSSASHISCKGR